MTRPLRQVVAEVVGAVLGIGVVTAVLLLIAISLKYLTEVLFR